MLAREPRQVPENCAIGSKEGGGSDQLRRRSRGDKHYAGKHWPSGSPGKILHWTILLRLAADGSYG
jgi:hypothetical protein